MLVAAIQVVDALHNGIAVGYQAGNHQAGRSAQVSGHHGGAGKLLHTFYQRGIALGADMRAHTVELGHMHEAVFKNGFHHPAAALGHRVHRHKLRLHIGGKTRMRHGAHVYSFRTLRHFNVDPIFAGLDFRAGFHQLVQHRFHGFGRGILQAHLPAGHGHGAEESAGFDAVGHHAVGTAVQLLHTFNRHRGRADTADFRAHFHQAFGQVHHFRLHCAVFQYSGAFGQCGCHQQVFRAAHGNHIHHHARAFELAARLHITVLDHDFRAHGFQPFQVLVHRSRADGAAAGQAYFRLAETRQRGAEHQNGSTHGFHQFIRCASVVYHAAIDFELAYAIAFHFRAHALQEFVRGFHVGQHRHVGQMQDIFG